MTAADPATPKEDRPRLPDELEDRLKATDRRAAEVYTQLEQEISRLDKEQDE